MCFRFHVKFRGCEQPRQGFHPEQHEDMTNLNQHLFDSIQQARSVTPSRTFQACRFHPAPRFTSPSAGFCPTHMLPSQAQEVGLIWFNQFNPSMSKKSIPKSSLTVELGKSGDGGYLGVECHRSNSVKTYCLQLFHVCIRTVYYKRFLHPVFPQSCYFSHETQYTISPRSGLQSPVIEFEVYRWSCHGSMGGASPFLSVRPWFLSRHRGLQFGLQICLACTGSSSSSPSKAGISPPVN